MKELRGRKTVFVAGKMLLIFLFLTAGVTTAAGASKILVLKGLGEKIYLPENTFTSSGFSVENAYLAKPFTGFTLDKPFPSNPGGLKGTELIVLADIPASALGGFMARRTLRQFVKNGGSLLVFGGPFSYGKGGVVGTPLADILPVTTTGPWDMVRTSSSPRVKPTPNSSLTRGLAWSRNPVLYYSQKTIPKPKADVLLEADGIPVLVTGRFGQGKVAAFMGTYLGIEKKGEIFFYKWSGYKILLNRIIQWLVKE